MVEEEKEKPAKKPKQEKISVLERERTANGRWRAVGEKKVSKLEAEAGLKSGKYLSLDKGA